MNLTVWLPALFLLGLATMALMFAFLAVARSLERRLLMIWLTVLVTAVSVHLPARGAAAPEWF